MSNLIRTVIILGSLLVMTGASTLAGQDGQAELLVCNEKTRECRAIGTIHIEEDCQTIVWHISSLEKTADLDRRMIKFLDSQRSAPPLAPADRRLMEQMQKSEEDLQKMLDQMGRQYYMCRPL